MTRETKIGLLVGMGVIIVIGILISDHLSDAQRQTPAELAGNVPEIQQDMIPAPVTNAGGVTSSETQSRLPMPNQARTTTNVQHNHVPRPQVITQDVGRELYPANMTDEAPVPQHDITQTQREDLGQRATPPSHPVAGDSTSGLGPDFVPVNTRNAHDAVEFGTPVKGAAPADAMKIHYVKQGESLASIAREYYGDPHMYPIIAKANGIDKPSLIRPGVRLRIPPKPGDAATPAPAPAKTYNTPRAMPSAPVQPKIVQYVSYTIASDDTLSDIAAKFYGSGKYWHKVYELNKDKIDNPNRIVAGTVIKVPATH